MEQPAVQIVHGHGHGLDGAAQVAMWLLQAVAVQLSKWLHTAADTQASEGCSPPPAQAQARRATQTFLPVDSPVRLRPACGAPPSELQRERERERERERDHACRGRTGWSL
jgi:hypothetical protein